MGKLSLPAAWQATRQQTASSIAVLIPACDEEAAIAGVIARFQAALPDADIYVYDNNSRDRTAQIARDCGVTVRREGLQGKGNVVRRMFADIDAAIYVLVDGDGTYDADAAPAMIALLVAENLDMVNAARMPVAARGAAQPFRPMHRFGNYVLTGTVRAVFGSQIQDMLSGYRVFSRRFVKSFPALARGFETETELTIHALDLAMPVAEIVTLYRGRAPGTASKLRTIRDGLQILRTIALLVKDHRPIPVFGLAALALLAAGIALGTPVVAGYLRTGLVPRLPTAVLATGLELLAAISVGCGLVLDSLARGRKEIKRLAYLSHAAPARVG
jgi:hypothetical protein